VAAAVAAADIDQGVVVVAVGNNHCQVVRVDHIGSTYFHLINYFFIFINVF
jgi:hypothetical protein